MDADAAKPEAEMAAKAQASKELSESQMPTAVWKFTKRAESERALAKSQGVSTKDMSVATLYFYEKALEEARNATRGGEAELMPAAIQHFTLADRAEKERKKQALEELRAKTRPRCRLA